MRAIAPYALAFFLFTLSIFKIDRPPLRYFGLYPAVDKIDSVKILVPAFYDVKGQNLHIPVPLLSIDYLVKIQREPEEARRALMKKFILSRYPQPNQILAGAELWLVNRSLTFSKNGSVQVQDEKLETVAAVSPNGP